MLADRLIKTLVIRPFKKHQNELSLFWFWKREKIQNYRSLYIVSIIKKSLVLSEKGSEPKKLKNTIKSKISLGYT